VTVNLRTMELWAEADASHEQHGAGVAGQALGAGLDKQAGVEGGGGER
jgi:hypothetical protein